MKKIIIINHYGITPDKPGATRHYDMAVNFANKNEYKIEFWMCGYNHHSGKNDKDLKGFKLQHKYIMDNVKLIKIKSSGYRRSSIMRQLNIMIFDFITSIKILFSSHIEYIILSVPPISIFNVFAAKIRRVKLITDVEDLWPLFLEDMGLKNKFVINYMNVCADYTYNHSDAIEAVSKGMLNYVDSRLKNNNIKMWLSPLGVDLSLYEENKLKNIDVSSKPWGNDIKIMYIGAHGRANGLEQVVNVASIIKNQISNVSFIIIGDGDQKKNLVEYAKEKKVTNIYFEDSIPSNLVPSYLNLADICLTNLLKIDSFKLVRPNKLFQYMAAKKPIICGIWGESKDIIEESKSGIYVDMENEIIAAEQIIDFINSNYERMGDYGYEYIKKNGDRNRIFKDFYDSLKKI